ncbi:septal ring lytic transglycosylase RlpA family protein [Salinicola halophilus]|uniref:septal ring lytic transglycosylase RlpA family protein n=1 Tax=Salinicola halophilus TaxID=184065 RepID=UPI001955161B
MRWLPTLIAVLALAGCAGGGGSGGGRYAQTHDAYPDSPQDVANVPDAVPKVEPRSKGGNRSTYTVWGKTYHVLSDPTGYEAVGRASWYGTKFQGYDTANGESYDMYKMSAAHRSLPLPSYARVTNLDNGRDVIVRVNDRGPFHEDRLIDLSYAAAARLDILKGGTGRVKVEAIDPVAWAREQGNGGDTRGVAASRPSAPAANGYAAQVDPVVGRAVRSPAPSTSRSDGQRYVQVAALGSHTGAQALKSRLQRLLSQPVRIDNAASLYRVQVGPIDDIASLQAIRATLNDAGYSQTFVVAPAQ